MHYNEMINETIQYNSSNRAKPVYLLLLDASKAFDKVSFYTLFNIYHIYRIPLFSSAEEWGRGRKLMACVTP